MKKYLLLSLLAVSVAACAEMGALYVTTEHEDWMASGVKYASHARFRAATKEILEPEVVALTLDRFDTDCDVVKFTINIATATAFTKKTLSEQHDGWLRVDDGTTHHLKFVLTTEPGETVAYVVILNFDKTITFDEIAAGDKLKIKVTMDNQNFIGTFSLKGIGAAMDNTLAMCQQFNALKQMAPDAPAQSAVSPIRI